MGINIISVESLLIRGGNKDLDQTDVLLPQTSRKSKETRTMSGVRLLNNKQHRFFKPPLRSWSCLLCEPIQRSEFIEKNAAFDLPQNEVGTWNFFLD